MIIILLRKKNTTCVTVLQGAGLVVGKPQNDEQKTIKISFCRTPQPEPYNGSSKKPETMPTCLHCASQNVSKVDRGESPAPFKMYHPMLKG
jgi:hypothetical protein